METLSNVSQTPRPEETSHAAIIHLSALSSLIGVPFGTILGPLITWLIWRDQSRFDDENGKEALNFNISMVIYKIIVIIIGLILFLSPLFSLVNEDDPTAVLLTVPGLWIMILGLSFIFLLQVILIVVAAIKAGNGETFRYPLTIRFIK